MRATVTPLALLSLLLLSRGWAASQTAPAVPGSSFKIAPSENQPDGSKFTPAQLAFVQSWIRQKAPECPPEASAAVAEQFLDELQLRYADKFQHLLSPDFPQASFESALLRQVGVKLTGANQGSMREKVAERRSVALLVAGGRDPHTAAIEAVAVIGKIKDASSAQYRRLVEGKMDDDELQLLVKKVSQPSSAPKAPAVDLPRPLTAADIVSEYSRHNQSGAAWQHMRAYVVEARLKPASGEEQQLLLFKARPDRFRLVVRSAGLTRYLLAGDGTRFWQQTRGQPPQIVQNSAMGTRRYLAEFTEALFVGDGFGFERLEDGVAAGKKYYRISTRRADGSGYISGIDPDTFREVIRENEDHSITRYSDFREVAGVTFAFREEATDQEGRKGLLQTIRITPNPGLIQDLFEMPTRPEMGYFQVEQYFAPATIPIGKSHQ